MCVVSRYPRRFDKELKEDEAEVYILQKIDREDLTDEEEEEQEDQSRRLGEFIATVDKVGD
jgi:hypothetical protein